MIQSTPVLQSHSIQNQENRSGMRRERNLFQTSIPHIMQSDRDQMDVSAIRPLNVQRVYEQVSPSTLQVLGQADGEMLTVHLSLLETALYWESKQEEACSLMTLYLLLVTVEMKRARKMVLTRLQGWNKMNFLVWSMDKSKQKRAVPSSDSGIQITI